MVMWSIGKLGLCFVDRFESKNVWKIGALLTLLTLDHDSISFDEEIERGRACERFRSVGK